MYQYGTKWTAADISENEIKQAKRISKGLDIDYYVVLAEDINFSDNSFNVITACQCFWYFKHETIMPKLYHILKQERSIFVVYMAWLPFEDKIAGSSESLSWNWRFTHSERD